MQAYAGDLLQKLEELVSKATKKGAEAADALCINAMSEAVEIRNQKLENAEHANDKSFGLRVIIDGKQAITSFSDDGHWRASVPTRLNVQAAVRPPSSRRTRSMRDARSRLWVAISAASPVSRASVRSVANTVSEVAGSRLPVGSSARSSFGAFANARQTATRCCSPPESCEGRCVARSVRPTSDSRDAARVSACARGTALASCGRITFSAAVNSGSK